MSDEAIAMHRRMSVRTVQRKVHALMDVANVQTRMQLAWEAATPAVAGRRRRDAAPERRLTRARPALAGRAHRSGR